MNRATSAAVTGVAVLGAGVAVGLSGTLTEVDPMRVPVVLIVLALVVGGGVAAVDSVRHRRRASSLLREGASTPS